MCKLLSFIIPTYNCEEYIEETLDFILSELPGNCELVLVDDGSSDSTPKILKKYESDKDRVKICFREHGGVSIARNAGLDIASGKWLAFMDCDDFIKDGFFKESLKLVNDDIDLYIFSFERVELINETSKDGTYIKEEVTDYLSLDDKVYDSASDFADDYMRRRNLLVYSSCNKFYKKSIVDAQGIRFKEGLSFGEDRLFNYDYLMHVKRIATSNIRMFKYLQRNSDSASKRPIPNYFETIMKLHRAKMYCVLTLSKGTDYEEKKKYEREDLLIEMDRLIDRIKEHPQEKEELDADLEKLKKIIE